MMPGAMDALTVEGAGDYEAEIRRTTHGVAHVRAGSWGSLGFGQGYAAAVDHGPTIIDQVVKVRGERASVFGAGPSDGHLASDVAYRILGLRDQAPAVRAAQPPHVAAMVDGYAAGLNRWLAVAAGDGLPAWCPPAAAVGVIDPLDLYATTADLAMAGGSRNLVAYMATARPPGPDGPAPAPPLDSLGGGLASNGWAVGRAASASGNAMVVANPHFPWFGEARLWECHLTLPGELDVYGVSLLGTPGVQMGFNRHVAWSHTFSVGNRFTAYRLELLPGEPTRYRYGDESRDMVESSVTVAVRADDGHLEERTQPVWSSHYGPMLNLPLLGWSEQFGFSFRDANAGNARFLSQFLAMNAARGLDEFKAVYEHENGIPWVNTMAGDSSGRVWYIDASRTPKLSPEGEAWFRRQLAEDPVTSLLYRNRAALLDGSNPDCEWQDVPGAPGPGLVPFAELPQLERDDWVANANESHWLTNPAHPLQGFSVLHGVEEVAPSPRTRANMVALSEPGSGPDGSLTAADLEERIISNRSVSASLLCDAVAERCRAAGPVELSGHTIDLGPAAEALSSWDRAFDLGSRGAALWREFMAGLPDEAMSGTGVLWADPFDLADPCGTPRGLAPAPERGPDPVASSMARAVLALSEAGVALDAPLGEVQWAVRGGRRVGVHGGQERDGAANILGPIGLLPSHSLEPPTPTAPAVPGRTELTGLRQGGYEVTYGTAWLMVVALGADGPRARGLLPYGQTGDLTSPEAAEQLEAYAAKALRPMLFEEADIAADPALRTEVVRSGR
jgi:acyl-homoserine-lactone acylase